MVGCTAQRSTKQAQRTRSRWEVEIAREWLAPLAWCPGGTLDRLDGCSQPEAEGRAAAAAPPPIGRRRSAGCSVDNEDAEKDRQTIHKPQRDPLRERRSNRGCYVRVIRCCGRRREVFFFFVLFSARGDVELRAPLEGHGDGPCCHPDATGIAAAGGQHPRTHAPTHLTQPRRAVSSEIRPPERPGGVV